jgi:hypothetical protein
MYMPNATPKLASPGRYYAELDGDAVEKESKFDPDKRYWQIPLRLTPESGGEPVRFLWFCQPDSEVLADALLAIGGRRNSSGGIDAPARPEGRRFLATIVKAVRKDGKEKRDLVAAERVDGTAYPADKPADDGPDPLDQAVRSKGPAGDDDIPF